MGGWDAVFTVGAFVNAVGVILVLRYVLPAQDCSARSRRASLLTLLEGGLTA